jgi:hypothetical protein
MDELSPACDALKDRDRWLGWSATQRVERLKLIVQNRRFLLLTEKGDFLFQIKGNRPGLQAQAFAALPASPFLPKPPPGTGA